MIGRSAYWGWLKLFAAVGLLIAYPVTFVCGLPTYFLLLHYRKSSYWHFGAAGASLAAIGALLFFQPLRDAENTAFVVLITASGAAVAIAFRGIAGDARLLQ